MSSLPVMELILPQPTGGNVPAFLSKLWKMVNNPEFGNIIYKFVKNLEDHLQRISSAGQMTVIHS